VEEDLKDYYELELKRLRAHADSVFQTEPFRDLAVRLGHQRNAPYRDPFVEWLLQGYAFLAARVRRRLDGEFPRFTQALLSVVHPPLIQPTPSMIVARFAMRPDPARMEAGALLERTFQLTMTSRGERGAARRVRKMQFSTGRPVRLWPVEATAAHYLPTPPDVRAAGASAPAPAAVSVTLRVGPQDAEMAALGADMLDLFIGDADATLFEALAFGCARCEAVGGGRPPAQVQVAPLGFDGVAPAPPIGDEAPVDPRDALLPHDARSFEGWRMLQEFFSLPARFQFLRLEGLRAALAGRSGRDATLIFHLGRRYPELAGRVSAGSVLTNCVPAVNLFEENGVQSTPEANRTEHPVLPDRGDPTGQEAHSVLAVHGVTRSDETVSFRPFFSTAGFGGRGRGAQRYFHTYRRKRRRPDAREERERGLEDYVGGEMVISIVDEAARPAPAHLKSLSIDMLCTNRHLPYLASRQPGGTPPLQASVDGGWKSIEVVAGPSPPRDGLPLDRRLWDAVSVLSLNYLSLVDAGRAGAGADALRQMLRLHAGDSDVAAQALIETVSSVSARPTARRLPPRPLTDAAAQADRAAPMAFARGLEIALSIDETDGRGAILAALLHRVLAGHADANSFVETVLIGADGAPNRARFAPLAGARRML
jgi:type VI secretion system protein ImpG